MKYVPREIREEVNVTPHHPLANLGYLLGVVVGGSVAIYALLGWAVDWVAPQVNPGLEAKIGRVLAQDGASIFGGQELKDDPRRDYVQALLLTFAQAEAERLPPTAHLIESEVANAAVLPGGHIFVTTALLQEVESENELAFILAHELGHHVHHDSLRQLGRGLVVAWGLQLALGSSGARSGANVLSASFNLQGLHYSRQAESAADRYALTAVCRHYGHGHGSLDFFQRLAADEHQATQRFAGYFHTHPPSQERIEQLTRQAAQQNCELEGYRKPLPAAIAP